MNKITYHYSAISKQIWFYICAVYLLIWALVFTEIKIFHVEKYYDGLNLTTTLLFLFVGIAFFIILSFQHYLCYSEYDDEKIIYHNRLLHTSKTFYYKDCHSVIFDNHGIKFYESDDKLVNKKKPIFYIPFFRFGKIEAIQANNFFILLDERQKLINSHKEFALYKTFSVLPGYGRRWKYLAFFYACLCIVSLSSCASPLAIAIGLIKSMS